MWRFLFIPFLLILSVQAAEESREYPLKQALLVSKTLSLINHNYVEPGRINLDSMFEASLNQIQKTVPEILAQCERPKFCTITVHQAIKRFAYPEGQLGSLRKQLKEILAFMHSHVDADTEKKEIEYAAIDGLLNELDPHSSFMSPEDYREFQVGTEGEFGGLGIVISIKEGLLTVMSPLEDTPAWSAGIKAGDHIVQINDESTVNLPLTEAVGMLRGPVGTKVTLLIKRGGMKSPLKKTLARAIINIEAVQSQVVKTPSGNAVGFIRVKSFQANTERDFHEQLMAMSDAKVKGVLLDLRNNPGGLLDQAVTLSDEILKEGTIVSTVGRDGVLFKQNKAHLDGYEGDWPLIVLVNEGSASASEILAGALKNNQRALVVGRKTFGKGSVQSVYRLPMEAALKITVAQYLTPGNQSIQSVGITPDIELFPLLVDKEHLDIVENIFKTEKDLEKRFDGQANMSVDGPTYTLRYLAQAPSDEKENEEYSNKLKLEKDMDVSVALKLLDRLQSNQRPQMLTEAKKILEEIQAGEEQNLIAGFEKLGIFWNAPSKNLNKKREGKPQAELSFHLLKGGQKLKKIPAGETVELKLQLKNVGNAPFHRLSAQTESEQYLFKNIEFAFGKVAPGETKTWETKLEIPRAAFTEEVPIQLKFQEALNDTPHPVDLILPIEGMKRPRFAHEYVLEENWEQKLKKGESVRLEVKVTNQGEGLSQKPVVALKNLNGRELFIEKGRVALKPLAAGASEPIDFLFHIDGSQGKEAFALELSISDAELIVGLKQKITLNISTATIDPPQQKIYSPPGIQVANLKERVFETPHLFSGEVKDDQMVRDLFIFLDEEKAFYESNPKNEKQLSFQTPLKLKEGSNVVLITARDNYNLVSREVFVLSYHPKEAKKKIANHQEKESPQ